MTIEQHPLVPSALQDTLAWLNIGDLKFSSSAAANNGGCELVLAPEDPLFILLKNTIGATNVKVFGKLGPPANSAVPLEAAALRVTVDLTRGKGKATSLVFSTSIDDMNNQFDKLPDQKSGLDVLANKLAVVLALVPNAPTLDFTMADLMQSCEYQIPTWMKKAASLMKLALRKDSERNSVWIFSTPCSVVTRTEFQLDVSSPDATSLNSKLKELLPGLTEFSVVMQRIVRYSPVFKASTARSQITFCSTVKLPGAKETDPAHKVQVTLEQDHVTVVVVNESRNLGFLSLLYNISSHFKTKFNEPRFDSDLQDFKDFFNNVLNLDLPAEGGKGNESSSNTIVWRECSFTVLFGDQTTPKLVAARVTFEANTNFGVTKETDHSTFLFRLSWSAKGLGLKASFKPRDSDQKIAQNENLWRQLNPLWNGISQSSQSDTAVEAISLSNILPSFKTDRQEDRQEDWPSWLPNQIYVLEMNVTKKGIVFQTTFSAPESKKSKDDLKDLEVVLSGLNFELILRHDFKKWQDSLLKTKITLTTEGLQEDLPDCIITASVKKKDKIWQFTGGVKALYFASLATLLPAEGRESIIQMMGHSMIFDLDVTYKVEEKTTSPSLTFRCMLFLAGLELDLRYDAPAKGQWGLHATLAADSFSPPEEIGLKSLLHRVSSIGGDELVADLPDILKNISVSTKEISVDFICTQSTSGFGSYLLWSITLHIRSFSISFVQIQEKKSKATPKRMLYLSLSGFPTMPDIPVAGEISLPFDALHLYWLSSDLTLGDKKLLDTEVFKKDTVHVTGQPSKLEDVALKQGLHFLVTKSAGSASGSPAAALIDHVVDMTTPPKEAGGDKKADAQGKEAPSKEASSKDAPSSEPKWPSSSQPEMIPYRKSQGGLQISDFGLQMKGSELKIYLTAIAHLGPLEIGLNGLTLNLDFSKFHFPVMTTLEPSFSLQGLGLGYSRGGITIVGELTHRPKNSAKATEDYYGGGVIIGTSKYTFTAAGAYDKVSRTGGETYDSLFIFGLMKGFVMKFGYVEVTRIMGGFGYNSHLNLPNVDRVQEFPFFELAKKDTSEPLEALYHLSDAKAIESKKNSLWFAAGVTLRAFYVIDIDGVVTVELSDEEPVFGLCALATATVPPNAAKDDHVFASVAFGLVGTLDPNHGVLLIQGQFLPQSFILSKSCHPTGGFAVAQWFEPSAHAGEFVFTVGGYHPAFVRPEHYPVVPRVGFLWSFDEFSSLTITGEAYFAITSSACMAGGKLSAVYQLSWLYAHLDAYADFLMVYEPFQYDLTVGVTAGVRAFIPCFICTISIAIELSAQLWLHGPPMAGIAHFTFWLFSFEITFGDAREPLPALKLDGFLDLLKQKQNQRPIEGKRGDHTISFANCLLPKPPAITEKEKAEEKTQGHANSLVRGAAFHLVVQSSMVLTRIVVGKEKDVSQKSEEEKADDIKFGKVVEGNRKIWAKPMNLTGTESLISNMTIAIEATLRGQKEKEIVSEKHQFTTDSIFENVPSALWGEYHKDDLISDLSNDKAPTVRHLTGVHIYGPKPTISDDKLPPFTKGNFDKISQSPGTINSYAPLFDATVPQFVLGCIPKRPLNPPTNASASNPDPPPDWEEAMFKDLKEWRKNPNPTISPKAVLDAFCALPSSNIPEQEISPTAPEAGQVADKPIEKPTDKFTYHDVADHTKAPTVYIDEMKDWYSAPPFLQDDFKVVTESK